MQTSHSWDTTANWHTGAVLQNGLQRELTEKKLEALKASDIRLVGVWHSITVQFYE